jgi:phage FluMu gp28-like protein
LYVIGCDLAKVQDFTVLSVYDRTNNCQVYQARFNKLEWPYQKSKIKELSKQYNNALVMLDATGLGDPIADDLLRDGVPVEPIHLTNEQKKQMIEKLANWIELGHIKMLQLDETIQEFNNFTYDVSEKTGRIFYNAPLGFHDDIVISHALAIWSLQPILKRKEEPKLTVIQRDFYEKRRAIQDDQDGRIDITEYESV